MRFKFLPLQQKTARPQPRLRWGFATGRMARATAMLVLMLALPRAGRANDIRVTNTDLTGQNTTDGYTLVQFDLNWENSWRTSSIPNNWDAAWVFVKYRVGSTGEWKHARLHPTGHSPGSGTGAEIKAGLVNENAAHHATTNPVVGAFIYRDANGVGPFSITGAQLRWNYKDDGVADADIVDFQVFAIEMVYVPEGAFWLGSGGTESGSFTDGSWTSGARIPFQVTSENAITINTGAGNLWGTSSSGNSTIGPTGTLPAAYPKGFGAFYSMKYEISQGQYVDFLNTLTRTQQNYRTETTLPLGVTSVTNRYVMTNTSTVSNRNGIRCDAVIPANDPITFYCDLNGNGIGGEPDDGQWVAGVHISPVDLSAYLDWSGLRPMTELEYEKACRGTENPVADEYAWGSSVIQATSISNGGTANEEAGNALANVTYNNHGSVQGPLRVGAFAKASTTREEAGTSYYGIMELSGNVWERLVTVGHAMGRLYTGLHGNGMLSTTGHADAMAWPGLVGGEVIGAGGSGVRGASWYNNSASLLRVSYRAFAADAQINRLNRYGGRGGRTVPSL